MENDENNQKKNQNNQKKKDKKNFESLILTLWYTNVCQIISDTTVYHHLLPFNKLELLVSIPYFWTVGHGHGKSDFH